MDLFMIIFNQFRQLTNLLKGEFNITLDENVAFPKVIEVENHRIQLVKINKHFMFFASMDFLFADEKNMDISLKSYNFDCYGEQLTLIIGETSGCLGLEFFKDFERWREWRAMDGEILSSETKKEFGGFRSLDYQPEYIFTLAENTRDVSALISIAEQYLAVKFDDWGVDLENL
ncbi:MAG: hypothetical protein KGV51_07530 [Moraxellaceae bacterium]|nr:hypothetical protein [Moraxellaceae bacterium]